MRKLLYIKISCLIYYLTLRKKNKTALTRRNVQYYKVKYIILNVR